MLPYYAYDANGNLISKNLAEETAGETEQTLEIDVVETIDAMPQEISYYAYDLFGKLTHVKEGNTLADYAYNGDGLRVSKTVNNTLTNHIWDNGNIVAETNVNNALTGKYYRGLNLIASENASSVKRYYLYNQHGDVIHLTDANKNVVQDYTYDAFGVQTNPNASDTNPFRYCGEYFDTETNKIYLRNRYYEPGVGRFTTEDPIRDGLNWYVYANNNPVKYHDPKGESAEILIIPWVRQQLVWMNGVRALDALNYDISAQMLHHSIRWFYADDVYISEGVGGVKVTGTDRIDGDLVVQSLENNSAINNEIDCNINYYEKDGLTHFETDPKVITLNNTTDLYLSFNNATVKLVGDKQQDGSWVVQVSVHDIYDFDIEKLDNIKSVKTAIGSAAGSVAALEQAPLLGAIKTYDIYVNYDVER